MTHEQREQAAEVLEKFQNGIYGHGGKVGLAIDIAIAALRGPQPDPETGLVPCGCGGKAEIGQYCEVTCDKCGASVPANYTEADAKAAWNRAMGWKGGAE